MPQFMIRETSDLERIWYIDAKDAEEADKMYWGDHTDTDGDEDAVYLTEPHEEEIDNVTVNIQEVT